MDPKICHFWRQNSNETILMIFIHCDIERRNANSLPVSWIYIRLTSLNTWLGSNPRPKIYLLNDYWLSFNGHQLWDKASDTFRGGNRACQSTTIWLSNPPWAQKGLEAALIQSALYCKRLCPMPLLKLQMVWKNGKKSWSGHQHLKNQF